MITQAQVLNHQTSTPLKFVQLRPRTIRTILKTCMIRWVRLRMRVWWVAWHQVLWQLHLLLLTDSRRERRLRIEHSENKMKRWWTITMREIWTMKWIKKKKLKTWTNSSLQTSTSSKTSSRKNLKTTTMSMETRRVTVQKRKAKTRPKRKWKKKTSKSKKSKTKCEWLMQERTNGVQ